MIHNQLNVTNKTKNFLKANLQSINELKLVLILNVVVVVGGVSLNLVRKTGISNVSDSDI